MLTKSAAKAFFLGGTFICSAAFAFLTVDTLAQFPERSNQDQMTQEVVRGWEIWTNNNCMGCHTLMGEGAYYAPELTRVVERRGAPWMREFLKDPQKFYPGRRKMVKYDIFDPSVDQNAEQNISDTIAFFAWVQEIDLNGFPAKPDLKISSGDGAAEATIDLNVAYAGAPDYFKTVCVGCHMVNGAGAKVGPALDGVATRYETDYLLKWIKDPTGVKPGTTMPNLGLTDAQASEIVSYLSTLK